MGTLNSYGRYLMDTVEDYERALRLIEQGKIEVRSLITKRFPVADIRAAFEYAGSGQGLKTLIETG